MKRVRPWWIPFLFAVWVLGTRCHSPSPFAAAIDVVPGTVPKAADATLAELVAAFDRVEAAVQRADLNAVMEFYAKTYNYHGLKRADVRRVWSEVFAHYDQVHSTHVFTGITLTTTGAMTKASVTCTGGLYGTDKESGKPITIDSWAGEVHVLVKAREQWQFFGNAGGTAPSAPAASAPHHPLF